jgi:hypothetical protein
MAALASSRPVAGYDSVTELHRTERKIGPLACHPTSAPEARNSHPGDGHDA